MIYRRLAKMFVKSGKERPLRITTWVLPIPFTRWGIAVVRNGWSDAEYKEEHRRG